MKRCNIITIVIINIYLIFKLNIFIRIASTIPPFQSFPLIFASFERSNSHLSLPFKNVKFAPLQQKMYDNLVIDNFPFNQLYEW